MSYSQDQLERLMADLESDLVERKESFSGDSPTKVREAVCAFANDLPDHRKQGVVFVGVADDGVPTDLPITDELLRSLGDIKTDGNIVPLPTLTVSKLTLTGHEVAVLLVQPADSPPVRYRGRVWIRVGPRRAIASAQDERILNERRRHRDQPFDVQPVNSATLDDLSHDTFRHEYLPSAFAREILEANERTLEQQLAATKMVVAADDPTPTVLGILTLSARTRDFIPGAYVQFVRVQGQQLTDPVYDEALIDGKLSDVLRRVDEKLEAHIATNVDYASSNLEARRRNYPRAALQQLARNAIMHRTYEATNTPVRVTWYDDRIEMLSPGGPFGMVTDQNFGQPGATDYRNPNLAEAMRVLGFVQRFGVGIATARELLRENDNPPLEFKLEQRFVMATIRTAE